MRKRCKNNGDTDKAGERQDGFIHASPIRAIIPAKEGETMFTEEVAREIAGVAREF